MNILNRKRLLPLGLISLLLLSAPVSAQRNNDEATVVVTGVVTNAALGNAMAGVKVQAYNNSVYSAMTREDGSFSIKVPYYVSSLTFQLDGYNTIVRSLSDGTEGVNVKMFSDVFSEIYDRKTVSGISSTATLMDVNADISVDNQVQQSLQGNILSNIRSGQIGVGSALQIDGISSININTQPLIVLDGVIMDMGFDNVSVHDGFYNNLLANIPVEDLESVTVLKNGYGIYGPKGANGVILIQTKRNKSMATKIDVNISGNYQTMPKTLQMMNADQYRTYASELLGSTGTKLSTFKFLQSDRDYHYYKMFHNDTDWSKVSYRDAFIQNYNVNVQGGDDIANYNLSVGFALGDATLVENDFSRFSLRLNSDIILADKLSLRFDAAYSDVTRDMRDDGTPDDIDNSMINSPGFLALAKAPFLSPYAFDVDGNPTKFLSNEDDYLDEVLSPEASLSNPLSILVNGDGINKNYFGNRLITLAVTPKYEFNRYLSLSEHFTYTLANADENYYTPILGTPNFKIEGIGTIDNKAAAMNAKQDGFMSNTFLTYARHAGSHDINVQGGMRYINNSLVQTVMIGYNSGNDKTPNITKSLKFKDTDGRETKDITMTWWAQGNYNYREKYYLSASLGMTSSSRFGTNVSNGVNMFRVPWGIFPSVSGAWVMSAEPWFKVPFIDYLRINAGYDLTGNDGFDDTASKTFFSSVKFLQVTGLTMSNIGNSSLQWETTNKLTAGINMNLFGNRLAIDANVFKSNTDNLLSISALSFLTGIETSWTNGGSLTNSGFDASFNLKLLNTKQIKWEAGASIGAYKNEITKLPGRPIDNEFYGATVRTAVGEPVGIFYGYRTQSTNGSKVYATTEEALASGLEVFTTYGNEKVQAGDFKFVDVTPDGVIDDKDRVKIGDPNPDFYGRIFTKVGMGNFSLSATMTYSVGGDIYNYQRMILESGSRFMNQTLAVTNRWMAEGQVTDVPRIDFDDPHGNARFSDRWIEDGSYLRLKNVTLSYRIPIMSTYLQGITLWGSANNLFTLTRYLGSDPEFSTSNNVLMQGIDRGLLPQSANFSLGIKINL
jgi:TonB-linked SusC/RagA family outer membrane protein